MNGFFYTLLITSVCGTVCSLLAFGGFEKYIKYIAALACTAVIISPLLNVDLKVIEDAAREEAEKLPTQQQDLYAISEKMTEERAEEYISEIVFNKFGIKPIYSDIKIDWEPEVAVIESITVALEKSDMESANEAKDYLLSVLGGEVEIIEG